MYVGDLVVGSWYEVSLAWAEEKRLRLDSITKTERGWKLLLSHPDQEWPFPEEIEIKNQAGNVSQIIGEWKRSSENPEHKSSQWQDRLCQALAQLGYTDSHVDSSGSLHVHGDQKKLTDLTEDLEEFIITKQSRSA